MRVTVCVCVHVCVEYVYVYVCAFVGVGVCKYYNNNIIVSQIYKSRLLRAWLALFAIKTH